jgi:hypothetical protein
MKHLIRKAQEKIDIILSDLESDLIAKKYFSESEQIYDLNDLIERKMNKIIPKKKEEK